MNWSICKCTMKMPEGSAENGFGIVTGNLPAAGRSFRTGECGDKYTSSASKKADIWRCDKEGKMACFKHENLKASTITRKNC